MLFFFFFQAEDGIRDLVRSRGLGDVYKRQTMEGMKLNLEHVYQFATKDQVFGYKNEMMRNLETLHQKTGKGNDFLGWLTLPSTIKSGELAKIKKLAQDIGKESDIVVVVGIGGSYLGAKAVIEALGHSLSLIHISEPTRPY